MRRTAALLHGVRHRLRAQAGFALPMTIGISLILGITGTTAMLYTTSNARSASVSYSNEKALSLAEAGLNYAYATLYNAPDPTMPGAVPMRSETIENGTVEWWGTLDTSTNTWTLTGRGSLPNPAGGVAVIRVVRGRAALQTVEVGSANNAIWNYIYSDGPTCTTLANSVNVTVPFYIKGDLCLQNTAQISGANTVLQVGGSVTIQNSGHIGSAGAKIAEAHIAGGCHVGSTFHNPCSTADSVYAGTTDSAATGLEKPSVDLSYWYSNAQPGPKHPCTSVTGTPPLFDNDSAMNRSLSAPVNLEPPYPYDCQVRDAQGALIGRIAWTPGSPGTLTIAGTIFFDGNISFSNLTSAVYVGRATIYASGTITLTNSTTLCGSVGCDSSWVPTQNLLAFVAGSSTDTVGFSIANSSVFQGAIYAVDDYSEQNGTTVWGPVIARQVNLANNTINHYVPLGTLLGGMPQSSTQAVMVVNQAGSYG